MVFPIKTLGKLFDVGSLSSDTGSIMGIDIGTSSVKVIQLTRGKSGPALETYGELQLGPYAAADIGMSVELEPMKLAAALVDIVREANVTARMSALAIPHSASFVVVADFPTRNQAELQSMVPIEARKYVPMAMNEISLDWFMVPDMQRREGQQEPSSIPVLLAAIHNESLKRYRSVVQNAGVAVGMNEIEAFSVIRASIHEQDESVLLLDLGAAATKTYLVESGILRETHRVPVGGQDITKNVATALSIAISEAEVLKRSHGVASDDARYSEAVKGTLQRIISDTERSLRRYETVVGHPVQKIILTGGGALLNGLEAYIATTLSRETAVAHPFSKVEHPAFLEATLKEAGPSFAVAIGVAIRKLSE